MIVGARGDLTEAGLDNNQVPSTGVAARANLVGQRMYRYLFINRYPPLPAGSAFNVEAGEWITPTVCVALLVFREDIMEIIVSSDSGSIENLTWD